MDHAMMILGKTVKYKTQLTLVNHTHIRIPIVYILPDLIAVNEYLDDEIIRVHGIPIVHYWGETE